MKTSALAITALLLTSGIAMAAPGHQGRWHQGGGVNSYERFQIANARAHLASVKARAWRDGRVTFIERYQIRLAENQLQRLVYRARRS